jgi:hypothetical protein
MKMKNSSVLFVFLAVFSMTFSFAQSPMERLVKSIEAYHQTYPFEKVYLHTDKPHYFLNDTIWIKAYGLMDVGQDNPIKTPTVPLYVELIQARVFPYASRIIIKLEDGFGQGDIVLPKDLSPGVYTLRAYTEWMRNFGADAFFEKNIWIGEFGDGWEFVNVEPELNLNFFPEGGYLVRGLTSKIGFKATDGLGRGIDVYGYILNSKKDTIQRFESVHMGMGHMKFTPQVGESYEVWARSSQMPFKKFNLATIQDEGIVMGIDPLWQKNKVKINLNYNLPAQKFNLLVQSKGKVVAMKSFDSGQKTHEWVMDQDDYLPGVYTFTLMDEETKLLAERLVYFLPFAQGKSDFRTEKGSYRPKEIVRMDIEVVDEYGDPIEGNFSVSVTDAYQVMHMEHSGNITSYLNLNSELKGQIESPGYYFNEDNPNAVAYLDNLMLTQGWRRFNWENLTKMSEQPKYLPESGLSLNGRVAKSNDQPINEAHQLTMLVNHLYGGPLFYEGKTDSLGFFTFIGMDYQDTVGVYLQAYVERERKNGSIREIKRNDVQIFPKDIPKPKMASLIGLPNGDQYLDFDDYMVSVKESKDLLEQFRLSKEIELGEVTVRGRRSNLIPDRRAIQYNDNPELSMVVTEEYYSFQNIYQLLRGRFAGVNVEGNTFDFLNPPAILMRGGQISGSGIVGARIFIDGMPVDPLWAMNIPVADIERVDILRSLNRSAVFGADGAAGVVNILTKSGNPNKDWSEVDVLGNATIVTQGYAPLREFYTPPAVPAYNAPFAIDFRSTIYWQPVVLTDPLGKANIEFRLTEGSPDVKVSLEGISNKGEPIHSSYVFKVSN